MDIIKVSLIGEDLSMKKCLLIFVLFITLNCEANFSSNLTSLVNEKENSLVFHGSPSNFEKVQPHYSARYTKGKMMWEGEAIFATPDYRIALFYTHDRSDRNFPAGIDLISPLSSDTPITYSLYGGQSIDEALDHLFGRLDDNDSCLGFIYVLRAESFRWEEGLGTMERISNDSSANVCQLCVHRREEIQKLIDANLLKLDWEP
jgi:hypothetical protein